MVITLLRARFPRVGSSISVESESNKDSLESTKINLAKKVARLEKLRELRQNITAAGSVDNFNGRTFLESGRAGLQELRIARQALSAKITQLRDNMNNKSMWSVNASALAGDVQSLESEVNAARKSDAYRKKEVVLSIARMHKAKVTAQDCIRDLPLATAAYESSLVALRLARDNVTKAKRRLYRLEEKVSNPFFVIILKEHILTLHHLWNHTLQT